MEYLLSNLLEGTLPRATMFFEYMFTMLSPPPHWSPAQFISVTERPAPSIHPWGHYRLKSFLYLSHIFPKSRFLPFRLFNLSHFPGRSHTLSTFRNSTSPILYLWRFSFCPFTQRLACTFTHQKQISTKPWYLSLRFVSRNNILRFRPCTSLLVMSYRFA